MRERFGAPAAGFGPARFSGADGPVKRRALFAAEQGPRHEEDLSSEYS